MYFLDGRSQDDIARVLETSRSNVSRMLGTARTIGIVEIRIQDELGRDADLEQALALQFDLTHVRVAAFRPQQDPLAATSALAAIQGFFGPAASATLPSAGESKASASPAAAVA